MARERKDFYTTKEFETFARSMLKKLEGIPALGVQRLASMILGRLQDSRLTGSTVRGPAGRTISEQGRITELGIVTARAVLELSPEIRFFISRPKTAQALRFLWPAAPPEVAITQRDFPVVYFTKVRVPVETRRISPEKLEEIGEKEFEAGSFQGWLEDAVRQQLVSGGQFR